MSWVQKANDPLQFDIFSSLPPGFLLPTLRIFQVEKGHVLETGASPIIPILLYDDGFTGERTLSKKIDLTVGFEAIQKI